MKHYYKFTPSGRSFAEHDVNPDEFFTAIGMVAVAFSELEDCLSNAIVSLLNSQTGAGRIVVAEMSFRAKVNLFASLVRHTKDDRSFAIPDVPLAEVLKDLCANVFKAEELRNTVMHSYWSGLEEYDPEKVVRSKATAKSKHGFLITQEDVKPGYLMDIVEFMETVAGDVVGFVFGTMEKTEQNDGQLSSESALSDEVSS